MRYYKFLIEGINSVDDFISFYKEFIKRFALLRRGWNTVSGNYARFEDELGKVLKEKGYSDSEIVSIKWEMKLLLGQAGRKELEAYLRALRMRENNILQVLNWIETLLPRVVPLIKKEDDIKDFIDGNDEFEENQMFPDGFRNTIKSYVARDGVEVVCSYVEQLIRKQKGWLAINDERLKKILLEKGLFCMLNDLNVEVAEGRVKKISFKTPKKEVVAEGFDDYFKVGKILFWDERVGEDKIIDIITVPSPTKRRTLGTGRLRGRLYKKLGHSVKMYRLINLKKGIIFLPYRSLVIRIKRIVEDERDKETENRDLGLVEVKYEGKKTYVPPYMAATVCPNCLNKSSKEFKEELEKNRLKSYKEIGLKEAGIHCFFVDNVDNIGDFNELVRELEEKFRDKIVIKGFSMNRKIGSMLIFNRRRRLGQRIKLIDILTYQRVLGIDLAKEDIIRDAVIRFRVIPLDRGVIERVSTSSQIEAISEKKWIQWGAEEAKLSCACGWRGFACELPTYNPLFIDKYIDYKNKTYGIGVLNKWGRRLLMDEKYFEEQKKFDEARGLKKEEKEKELEKDLSKITKELEIKV